MKRFMIGCTAFSTVAVLIGQVVNNVQLQSKLKTFHGKTQSIVECQFWVKEGGIFIERVNGSETLQNIRFCLSSSSGDYVWGNAYTDDYINLDQHDYDSLPDGLERTRAAKTF